MLTSVHPKYASEWLKFWAKVAIFDVPGKMMKMGTKSSQITKTMHFHHQERFLPIFHGLRFFLNFFRVPMKFLHYNESIRDKKIKISFSSIILTSYMESVQKINFLLKKWVSGVPYLRRDSLTFFDMHIKSKHF